MRRLVPLVAHFSDQVIRELRQTTLGDLAELMATEVGSPRSEVTPAQRRKPPGRGHRPQRGRPAPLARVAARPEQEITNPQAILGAVALAEAKLPTFPVPEEPEPSPASVPESGSRLSEPAVTPRLNPGEMVLRSGAGFVIRRPKASGA